ncbi:MAG: site-2 protease family protein, partial [Pseudomonadota bacterium]|nr:site-2 protease family protein [Pseudomonadota bacterium]
PIPPLDGGRILTSLLPYPAAIRLAAMERYGLVLLVGLIFLLPFVGNQLGFQLNVFAWLVGMPAEWLARLVLTVAGHL